MSNSPLTINHAEAIFIKSLSYFVWILGLAILVGAYLTLEGYSIETTTIVAIRDILINALWILVIFKILHIAEDAIQRHQSKL